MKVINDQEIEVVVDDSSTAIPALMESLKAQRLNTETVEQKSVPFDDVFVKLIETEAADD